MTDLADTLGRPLRDLRISVTDRCNLRCEYCMPETDYVWLPRDDILSFEEVSRLTDVFIGLGVDKVRLTGGEPLLRHDVVDLVSMLGKKPGLRDLAMTTNGVLLGRHAQALRDAGLHRLNISLDTLDQETFAMLAKRDDLERSIDGILAARSAGFDRLKIDTVVIAGVNEDELIDMLQFGSEVGAEVRFIEYMDVAGATRWSMERVVPRSEILACLRHHFGPIETIAKQVSAPADRFALPDGTTFGIISSTTEPFCQSCNRSRLTADGMWYTCLYATAGTDLRRPLREGASDAELAALVARTWGVRDDRGAEKRLALRERRPLAESDELRRNPHWEMHTRGG